MNTANTPWILIVEDDERIAELTRQLLAQSGYRAEIEPRGDTAVERIVAEQPDLVLLDLNLPGLDGLEVCRRIRPRYAGPVIMLTARGDPIDEIIGLELGADDYVAKPMKPRVLLARVRARLRQPAGVAHQAVFDLDGLRIDPGRREATVEGRSIELTTAEFDLLHVLARKAGEVVDRDALYLELRGVPYDGIDRTIDLRVARIRRLIGDDPRSPRWIKTVRGAGYLMVRPR